MTIAQTIKKEKNTTGLSPEVIKKNIDDIIAMLADVDRPGMAHVIDDMVARKYFRGPASTRYHGNFEGGLAAHSMAVYEVFSERVKEYGLDVPEESIRICSFLHDYCKIGAYEKNPLKNGAISLTKPWRMKQEIPLGHGEASVMQLLELGLKLTDQEKVIIRWHMGPYEGEPWKMNEHKIKEQYPEALVFHNVDHEVSTMYNL